VLLNSSKKFLHFSLLAICGCIRLKMLAESTCIFSDTASSRTGRKHATTYRTVPS